MISNQIRDSDSNPRFYDLMLTAKTDEAVDEMFTYLDSSALLMQLQNA